MTSNPTDSLSKTAWGIFRKEYKKVLPTAFNFLMVVLMVMALGIWYPVTLYFTVPFILIPFFFAFQMAATYLRRGDEITNRQFFAYFGAYFGMPFFGAYRVSRSFLLALAWSIVAGLAVAIIYYLIGMQVSPDFADAIKNLYSIWDNGSSSDFTAFVTSNTSIIIFQNVVGISELFVGFYLFLHYIASNGCNPYLRSVIVGASPHVCNVIYAGGIHLVKDKFWKDYYGALWHGILLIALGFALGVWIGFALHFDVVAAAVTGFSGAAILLSFYLPYYFLVIGLLADKYRNSFADYSIRMAQETLRRLKETQQLSAEEAQHLQDSIDSAQKARNVSAGDEDKKDDGSSGKDSSNDSK
jgi:hypothetical protein